MSAKDPVKGDPRSEAGMTLQEAGMTMSVQIPDSDARDFCIVNV